MNASLSIIIPTHDPKRPLARCLESIAEQPLHSGDEVIVIGDTREGELPEVERLVQSYGSRYRYLPFTDGLCTYGHAQLNYGLEQAASSWLLCQDDDDIYSVGAFDAIRDAIAGLQVPRPLLFRFRSYHGLIYWQREGLIARNHIGGHCAVFPNIPSRLGRFGPDYTGDYDYIRSTLDLWPEGDKIVVWRDQIIAIARPDGSPSQSLPKLRA